MNERGECPQKSLSILRGVLDRVDAQASVSTIANLRNVRQPRTESYVLRGHGRRRRMGRGGQDRQEQPGLVWSTRKHQAARNCLGSQEQLGVPEAARAARIWPGGLLPETAGLSEPMLRAMSRNGTSAQKCQLWPWTDLETV